jgi:hypothetical protein
MAESWTRGCDPDDPEAVAAALEEGRHAANFGSTGGVVLPYHPCATGGNQGANYVADAGIVAAIDAEGAARNVEKGIQSVQIAAPTPLATSLA